MRILLVLLVGLWTSVAAADIVRMAVTTSFHNSGLADVLLPLIAQDTGHDIQLLVVGTGQALRLGQSGDVDAVLVHSKRAEQAFVAAGHGPYRREIMYNDFVILGPNSDPAGLNAAKTAVEALSLIAQTDHVFVSRGDESGTHKAELALWTDVPQGKGTGYRETGSGMGATLNIAVGLGAYVLTDRASWLNFANKADLKILFQGDPRLFNQYAFLPVSKSRHPHVNAQAVHDVENWLIGESGQAAIGAYRLDNQQVFFPNAD